MPKLRRMRRAERERRQREALELQAKRARRRAFRRRITLYEWRRRSSGRLFVRRSRGERAFIAAAGLVILFVIWTAVPSLALKVALSLLLALALPVLIIIAFDRRSS
jgi:hypothetical protein